MRNQSRLLWVSFAVVMVIPIVVFIRFSAYDMYHRPKNNIHSRFKILKPEETLGKIITRTDFGWEISNKETCKRKDKYVLTKILPHDVPIFVYDPENDIHISRMIINTGSWEGDLVDKMVQAMKKSQDAVFIDIGANIGIYSMTMAALGYRVIAIDCFIENVMRLCASATIANVTDKITIIHNSVSDTRRTFTLIESSEPNVGGMEIRQMPLSRKSTNNLTSNSILLDDLLELFPIKKAVIKMDVEKHEDEILRGAKQFFKNVVVDTVLLEFRFHTKDDTGQFIIDFLHENGLDPVLPTTVNKTSYSKWPGDILWQRYKGK